MNPILKRFQLIEHNFNQQYLTILGVNLTSIVCDEEDEKDKQQHAVLKRAYEHWYFKIQANPRCTHACQQFYDSVKDFHDLIMQRDTQLFTIKGDLLTNIFNDKLYNEKGKVIGWILNPNEIDTPYLFDQLRDGLESDDEEGEQKSEQQLSEEEKDAKANFWFNLISLYRLSVMICIYLQTPLVKEIINVILEKNPDLNQSNILPKISNSMLNNGRLRRLVMSLLKSNRESFKDIFDKIQRVLATLDEKGTFSNMGNMMGKVQEKVYEPFQRMMKQIGLNQLEEKQVQEIADLLEAGKSLEPVIEQKWITPQQAQKIQETYTSSGLDKQKITRYAKSLGDMMQKMAHAFESKDKDAIDNVMKTMGDVTGIDMKQWEKIQNEFEKEEAEAIPEGDEEEEEEDKIVEVEEDS